MDTKQALLIARKTIVDGATLAELKEAVRDLRTLSPNSALAQLVEDKIKVLERKMRKSSMCFGC